MGVVGSVYSMTNPVNHLAADMAQRTEGDHTERCHGTNADCVLDHALALVTAFACYSIHSTFHNSRILSVQGYLEILDAPDANQSPDFLKANPPVGSGCQEICV